MPAPDRHPIEWISVAGFRSLKNVERLKLGPINVLIGANGSGKSNFLEVFLFLREMATGGLRNYVGRVGGAEEVLHFGPKNTAELTIHIAFQANEYKAVLSPARADTLHVQSEEIVSRRVYSSEESGRSPVKRVLDGGGEEAKISDPDTARLNALARHVHENLMPWRLYHFHDTGLYSPIKKTAKLDDNRYLRPDGSNLAAFLYLLRERHASSYDLIRRTIRLVAPFFKDFALEPQALNKDTIILGWRHEGTDTYFSADSLSDGSLRFIALATLLLQPKEFRPSVILLDEPELGLHPYAITMLDSLIKQAAVETQIILATQSTLLLDHQQPEDILVADRVNGGTRITRCEDDRERLLEWLEDYSLGELWLKNEIGGRPARETIGGGLQR